MFFQGMLQAFAGKLMPSDSSTTPRLLTAPEPMEAKGKLRGKGNSADRCSLGRQRMSRDKFTQIGNPHRSADSSITLGVT